MHPDLETLLALQEKDKAVTAVDEQLAALVPEETQLDAELEAYGRALEDAGRGVAGAEARQVELEQRIEAYKSAQERRRQQLDFVRGGKEAAALMAEIDMARSVLVKEEADFLRSGDAIVEAAKREADARIAYEAMVEQQTEARAALAARRAELQHQRAAAQGEREGAAAEVDPPALARYQRIRRGRSPLALYAVRADACGHCFTAVPMQRRMTIKRGDTIESCEVCGVLLYAEE